jgi:putative flavoprotein involved in K+ transport
VTVKHCEVIGMSTLHETKRISTVVIGAGQAGLSVGYHLVRRGLPFTILDANRRVGDSWRQRWESLRLFTPAGYDGLVGMPFPAPSHAFPTKDEMANYLEEYAARFGLPVESGVRVDGVSRNGSGYIVTAGSRRYEADNVVVAMANYQQPRVPQFAQQLDSEIVQLHSIDYRKPSQLRDGNVLIVGAGNSGSEIAMELAKTHRVWLSGRHPGHLPFRIAGLPARLLLLRIVLRLLFYRVLTVDTRPGRKIYPKVTSHAGPLIRVMPKDMAAAGIERVPRVTGVRDGRPVLEDGRKLRADNVVWCTGFHPGFSWIALPIFEDGGRPRHNKGIVPGQPGLYFVGLHFLHALSSAMIHGVGRDAERVVAAIASR